MTKWAEVEARPGVVARLRARLDQKPASGTRAMDRATSYGAVTVVLPTLVANDGGTSGEWIVE